MTAELEHLHGRAARWRFALGCAWAALAPSPRLLSVTAAEVTTAVGVLAGVAACAGAAAATYAAATASAPPPGPDGAASALIPPAVAVVLFAVSHPLAKSLTTEVLIAGDPGVRPNDPLARPLAGRTGARTLTFDLALRGG
jgi:hypothetical protein